MYLPHNTYFPAVLTTTVIAVLEKREEKKKKRQRPGNQPRSCMGAQLLPGDLLGLLFQSLKTGAVWDENRTDLRVRAKQKCKVCLKNEWSKVRKKKVFRLWARKLLHRYTSSISLTTPRQVNDVFKWPALHTTVQPLSAHKCWISSLIHRTSTWTALTHKSFTFRVHISQHQHAIYTFDVIFCKHYCLASKELCLEGSMIAPPAIPKRNMTPHCAKQLKAGELGLCLCKCVVPERTTDSKETRQRQWSNRMLINFQQINTICVSSEILQREQFFSHEVWQPTVNWGK